MSMSLRLWPGQPKAIAASASLRSRRACCCRWRTAASAEGIAARVSKLPSVQAGSRGFEEATKPSLLRCKFDASGVHVHELTAEVRSAIFLRFTIASIERITSSKVKPCYMLAENTEKPSSCVSEQPRPDALHPGRADRAVKKTKEKLLY